MDDADKWWAAGLTVVVVTALIVVMTMVTGQQDNNRDKQIAAIEAGMEQQQKEGSTKWLWAYPKEEN